MASSSSDESSKAPENFQVSSTSNEEDDDVVELKRKPSKLLKISSKANVDVLESATAPSLKCLICLKRQHRFHCRDCVKSGYITQKAQPHGECLSEKQQKYLKVQADLKVLSQRYEVLINKKRESENLLFEIKRRKKQAELLKQLIAKKKNNLESLITQHNELSRANSDKRKNLPKYPIKVKGLQDYVLDRKERIEKLRERHYLLLDKLKEVSRRNINNLVEYIFPISEVVLKDERSSNKPHVYPTATEDSDTVAALADAKNTSYIRGKWVFHGSGISEMQHRIVAPSLPANGDYSAYLEWLKYDKTAEKKITSDEIIRPSSVNGFRIVGALMYTAQLVQLICYNLNVRLPNKVGYREFCKSLTAEKFLRRVSGLNSNIMYLAYTQRVKLRNLNENHTLENMLIILDPERADLGRHGFQEVANAPLVKSVDSLLIGIETTTDSESEDENFLRLDWEALANLSTDYELIDSDLMPAASGSQQQSTTTEGLVTSAANRLTSMLRWIK